VFTRFHFLNEPSFVKEVGIAARRIGSKPRRGFKSIPYDIVGPSEADMDRLGDRSFMNLAACNDGGNG
jgi:hypothetical protein